MKYIIPLLVCLPMRSFAVNCPENANLDDKSSRTLIADSDLIKPHYFF